MIVRSLARDRTRVKRVTVLERQWWAVVVVGTQRTQITLMTHE